MDRGTYSSASGGLVQLKKLEIINNNLANVNTAGFKRQMIVGKAQSFEETLASTINSTDVFARGDHERTPGVVNVRTVTDFSPGPIKNTGNPLDAALLNPTDFFVVTTPQGEQYTRAGNFTVNDAGELVTMDGMQVMGDGGALVANGPGVKITSDGSVTVNGARVGALRVVRFSDTSELTPVGNTRFALPAGSPEPAGVQAELEPQALEMANVSVINGVLELISTNRAFDLYTRSARTIDEMNTASITQVGRRR